MFRVTCIAAVGLLSAGAAYGQTECLGNVCSYYSEFSVAEDTIVPVVPEGGLVITDIVVGNEVSLTFEVVEVVDSQEFKKFQITSDGRPSFHFQSGIPFAEGSSIKLVGAHGSWLWVTLSGYIPGAGTAPVPAISATGLGVMLLFIVAVGGFVFSRMKRQVV